MNEKQHIRANQIQSEIKSIQDELRDWEYSGAKEVRQPLKFRMSERCLENIPPQVFADFKMACIVGLNKRINELNMEYAAL